MPLGIVVRSTELPSGDSFLPKCTAALFQRALQSFRAFHQLLLEIVHLL
jgi:hypothetical protein